MPPRIRGTRTTKILKENIGVGNKTKSKSAQSSTKSTRKVLADKTNSTSDDNASKVYPTKIVKKPNAPLKRKHGEDMETNNNGRKRRERRLPNRYAESEVLKNLSKSHNDSSVNIVSIEQKGTTNKNNTSTEVSPFKTPQKMKNISKKKSLQTSLLAKRPKRVCRLPSKFDDDSISPSKFVPVQPCHASTPIANKSKPSPTPVQTQTLNSKARKPVKTKQVSSPEKGVSSTKKFIQTSITEKFSEQNNNARKITKSTKNVITEQNKTQSPEPQKCKTNLSFKNLGTKKTTEISNDSNMDVYEFTFDPKEEPKQQKKKRKRVVKKKPAEPKLVVYKNNYDKNISKALSALKSVVSKPGKNATKPVNPEIFTSTETKDKPILNEAVPVSINNISVHKPVNRTVNEVHNHISVRIEDIAANLEPSDHHDINYSPVNSPNCQNNSEVVNVNNIDDPLNLREESFFDEPVASSSMNVSVRHPDASPWRPNFNELPIKWQVNSYVKANMTPAVECSYINSGDTVKKHVYTNMIAESNDSLPQIVESTPKMKQPSIISFIKEVVERSANKKRGVSVTPTKNNSIFDDISVTDNRQITPVKESNNSKNSSGSRNSSNEVGTAGKSRKRRNDAVVNAIPAKTPCTEKDRTFFGFDSEDLDQENVPPKKNVDKNRVKSLRPRAKAVLKEINKETGPMRAEIPIAVKANLNAEVIDKVYDELKNVSDAPTFPENNAERNIPSPSFTEEMDDSQSVHLFEDIELIHHLKPTRKSYGKSRKVTFRQRSVSDSDADDSDVPELADSEVDDLSDLSFQVPNVKQKKPGKKRMTKKQKLTKKEEQEVEAWAAGFNSMCEDIDEFDLVVE